MKAIHPKVYHKFERFVVMNEINDTYSAYFYEFLDENKLFVSVHKVLEDETSWAFSINRDYFLGTNTRSGTQAEAFVKAFEILNKQLTE